MADETEKKYKALGKNGVLFLWERIKSTFAKKEDVPTTYAGSSSAGGAATSADKINTDAGSATQPVYFANGVPVATDYTLAKSVPADANFDDTTYEAFKGATSGKAGDSGLVPAPAAGDIAKYLAGDGTWKEVEFPTYSDATQSASGLMSGPDKKRLDEMEDGANKTVVDSAITAAGTNPVEGGAIHTALGLKADLAGADFTGPVTVPTATEGDDSTKAASTAFVKGAVDNAIAGAYKPSGSMAFADLPKPAKGVLGNLYNVSDAFTTTDDFVEGAGKKYPLGTNVGVVNVGTASSPSYKLDVMAGFIDTSAFMLDSEWEEITNAELQKLLEEE